LRSLSGRAFGSRSFQGAPTNALIANAFAKVSKSLFNHAKPITLVQNLYQIMVMAGNSFQ